MLTNHDIYHVLPHKNRLILHKTKIMKIQLIKTKELDGDWYKIRINGFTKTCIHIIKGEEAAALDRANEIYDFYKENRGQYKVIKGEEI